MKPLPKRITTALVTTAAALWAPCLIAAALSDRVRRSLHDVYFWPGIVPGKYLSDHFYDESFVWTTLATLAAWTWITTKRRWLGLTGAALQGFLSTGNLMALVNM